MILGGTGCQKCSCVPCDPCEQECVEPHTGDPFETVYTRFFEGVEAGNPTDGYLTATGDSDTDDPYDGMDGSAPWYQQVSGSFSFGSGVTRHPCSINISFWRNSYALGPATIPPAGSTLTYEKITVTCNSGKIFAGDTILEAGQEYETTLTIPVVAGTGDQSEADPVTYFGTINVRPVCREASFSVQARIEWQTQKRQHILYGKVRECYEDPENPPCAEYCDGDPPPDVLYLTVSNVSITAIASGNYGSATYGPGAAGAQAEGQVLEGSYVLERVPGSCNWWMTEASGGECSPPFFPGKIVSVGASETTGGGGLFMASGRGNSCLSSFRMTFTFTGSPLPICGSWSRSGTSTSLSYNSSALGNAEFTGSFDWEIST